MLKSLALCFSCLTVAGAAQTVVVSRTARGVEAVDGAGKLVAASAPNGDDAAVVQAAVDAVFPGGRITIRPGRYVFRKSVVVWNSTTISGDGRQTVIVPPARDFAFRLLKREDSRTIRWEVDGLPIGSTAPPRDCRWLLSIGERTQTQGNLKLPDDCSPLLGIVLQGLTIDGEKNGKGVYLDHVAECTLRDLWIHNTHGGAGLYIRDVWETSFDNIHLLGNGSRESAEASVVITAEGANNLHFDRFFVIFPNYVGLEIGSGAVREDPRLIFVSHAMFHGWLPVPTVREYDLIRIRNLDPYRGLVLRDSRLTNSGPDNAYLNVEKGDVKLQSCVLGGGRGGAMIRLGSAARVTANANSFHATSAPAGKTTFTLDATGGELTFVDNLVSPGTGPLRLVGVRNSIVSRNRFLAPAKGPRIRIEDRGPNGCSNVVVNNNFFPASEADAVSVSPFSKTGTRIEGNFSSAPQVRPDPSPRQP
jgi:hypothetical protein